MAQIARLLAVATVFIGLWTRNNWGLICETKLSMQELELKMQGGGRNCGILRYYGLKIVEAAS